MWAGVSGRLGGVLLGGVLPPWPSLPNGGSCHPNPPPHSRRPPQCNPHPPLLLIQWSRPLQDDEAVQSLKWHYSFMKLEVEEEEAKWRKECHAGPSHRLLLVWLRPLVRFTPPRSRLECHVYMCGWGLDGCSNVYVRVLGPEANTDHLHHSAKPNMVSS
ncbi:hypothetical protein Pcinc_001849 [Petrolisthes cinctipes]|uniref:Uncharacterized protein n=1 Tax=Petrolisthes cinctipes TaxID=88211 RepID=A0AAE1GJX6_PETCI|nr:hypothetical protein Pcinc_001849 [Petrolisthes cinctipes]